MLYVNTPFRCTLLMDSPNKREIRFFFFYQWLVFSVYSVYIYFATFIFCIFYLRKPFTQSNYKLNMLCCFKPPSLWLFFFYRCLQKLIYHVYKILEEAKLIYSHSRCCLNQGLGKGCLKSDTQELSGEMKNVLCFDCG